MPKFKLVERCGSKEVRQDVNEVPAYHDPKNIKWVVTIRPDELGQNWDILASGINVVTGQKYLFDKVVSGDVTYDGKILPTKDGQPIDEFVRYFIRNKFEPVRG